jgi:hypothetical protein
MSITSPRLPCCICSSSIRFFSLHVLQRDWHTLSLIRAQTEHRLPAMLSVQEVRRLILMQHPVALKAPEVEAPAPFVVSCPTCSKPMQLVMRRWTSHQAFFDTG